MSDGVRLRPKRRTYTLQVAVPPDLAGRVVGARGQPVDVLRRQGATDVHVHDLPNLSHPVTGGVSYDMSFMKSLGL